MASGHGRSLSRRRVLLGAASVGALAGCTGGPFGSAGSDGDEDSTGADEADGTDVVGTAGDAQDGDARGAEQDEPERAPDPRDTAALAQYQYDGANTAVAGGAAPREGSVAWEASLDGLSFGIAAAEDAIAVHSGAVTELDATDGSSRWARPTPNRSGATPVITPDTVYVTRDEDGEPGLVALSREDGRVRWTALPEEGVDAAPTLADGTVYLGSGGNDDVVAAVDATTGAVRWRSELRSEVPSPAVAGDLAYFGGVGHEVVALDRADGTTAWTAELSERPRTPPTVAGDELFVGGLEGSVFALDRHAGETLWATEVDALSVRDSLGVTEDRVFVPCAWTFQALTRDGDRDWSTSIPSYASGPTVTDDAVLFAHDAVSCHERDGTERWEHPIEGPDPEVDVSNVRTGPFLVDGTCCVISRDGDLTVLE